MKESAMKYVKAIAAIMACVGVVITPEMQEAIIGGFLAVYSIVSMVQGKIKERNE